MTTFLDLGGLNELLRIIDEVSRKPVRKTNELEAMHFSILALKALMNNKLGIKAVLNHEGALDVISLALDSPALGDKSLTMEILTVMCYVEKPLGHKKVLRGNSILARFIFYHS